LVAAAVRHADRASADAKRHEAGRFCGIAQQQMLEA
jgi:hypothetical protein